jgi:hypothetical protein
MIDLIKHPDEIDNDPFMLMIGGDDYDKNSVIKQIMIEALYSIEQAESISHRIEEFPDYELIRVH